MPSIFKVKTCDAYSIKVLSELLQNNLKTALFKVNKDGITLRMINNNLSILIDLVLEANKFNLYKFNYDKDLHLGINLNHFHKMLKSVKKKDSLVLSISDDSLNELDIKVIPKENNRVTESRIKIQTIQNLEIELPEDYSKHVIIPSNEFQKTCKDMSTIGNYIVIISKGFTIKFCCDGGNIYSKNITFGEIDDDSDQENDDVDNEYNEKFDIEQFIRLSKITGLSNSIQIFPKNGLPLLFKTAVGNLGEISIYIKSKEFLEEERKLIDE